MRCFVLLFIIIVAIAVSATSEKCESCTLFQANSRGFLPEEPTVDDCVSAYLEGCAMTYSTDEAIQTCQDQIRMIMEKGHELWCPLFIDDSVTAEELCECTSETHYHYCDECNVIVAAVSDSISTDSSDEDCLAAFTSACDSLEGPVNRQICRIRNESHSEHIIEGMCPMIRQGFETVDICGCRQPEGTIFPFFRPPPMHRDHRGRHGQRNGRRPPPLEEVDEDEEVLTFTDKKPILRGNRMNDRSNMNNSRRTFSEEPAFQPGQGGPGNGRGRGRRDGSVENAESADSPPPPPELYDEEDTFDEDLPIFDGAYEPSDEDGSEETPNFDEEQHFPPPPPPPHASPFEEDDLEDFLGVDEFPHPPFDIEDGFIPEEDVDGMIEDCIEFVNKAKELITEESTDSECFEAVESLCWMVLPEDICSIISEYFEDIVTQEVCPVLRKDVDAEELCNSSPFLSPPIPHFD